MQAFHAFFSPKKNFFRSLCEEEESPFRGLLCGRCGRLFYMTYIIIKHTSFVMIHLLYYYSYRGWMSALSASSSFGWRISVISDSVRSLTRKPRALL